MQYTGVCRIAQMPKRGWLLGFGREVFFPRYKCRVERTEYLMWVSCLTISIYIYCYCVIYLYIYIVIALFIYSVVCLLLYCMLTALVYYFLYIYILFLFLTSTSIFLLLWLPSLYHLAFYGAKVWRFCQIPNTRRCLIRLKLFRNAFHKCCTFGFSKKLSTELFGVLTPRNHHLLMHVKRLYDDEMTE